MARKVVFDETLYMLINVTSVEQTALVAIADLKCVSLLGHIHKHAGMKVIAPPLEGRGFSKLDKLALQYFYWNVCQETPPEDYETLVTSCLARLKALPKDESTYENLMREINRLGINLEDPTAKTEKEPAAPKDPHAAPVRPKGQTLTGLVWELADEQFVKAGNQMPDRKAVIDACLTEEINQATASTQYAKWAKAKRAELGI